MTIHSLSFFNPNFKSKTEHQEICGFFNNFHLNSTHGLRIHKIKTTKSINIFSMSLSKKHRLIYCVFDGHIIVLENLPQHNYQKFTHQIQQKQSSVNKFVESLHKDRSLNTLMCTSYKLEKPFSYRLQPQEHYDFENTSYFVLNQAQNKLVDTMTQLEDEKPLLIVAGPGHGKTTAIIEAIAQKLTANKKVIYFSDNQQLNDLVQSMVKHKLSENDQAYAGKLSNLQTTTLKNFVQTKLKDKELKDKVLTIDELLEKVQKYRETSGKNKVPKYFIDHQLKQTLLDEGFCEKTFKDMATSQNKQFKALSSTLENLYKQGFRLPQWYLNNPHHIISDNEVSLVVHDEIQTVGLSTLNGLNSLRTLKVKESDEPKCAAATSHQIEKKSFIPLVLAGDPNQGLSYKIFQNASLKKMRIEVLLDSFRMPQAVEQLHTKIMSLKTLALGGNPAENILLRKMRSLQESKNKGMATIGSKFDISYKQAHQGSSYVNTVVITSKENKAKVKEKLNKIQQEYGLRPCFILTPEQMGGLQFEAVISYNILSDQSRVVESFLKQEQVIKNCESDQEKRWQQKTNSPKSQSVSKDNIIAHKLFNQVGVALSRASKHCSFIESSANITKTRVWQALEQSSIIGHVTDITSTKKAAQTHREHEEQIVDEKKSLLDRLLHSRGNPEVINQALQMLCMIQWSDKDKENIVLLQLKERQLRAIRHADYQKLIKKAFAEPTIKKACQLLEKALVEKKRAQRPKIKRDPKTNFTTNNSKLGKVVKSLSIPKNVPADLSEEALGETDHLLEFTNTQKTLKTTNTLNSLDERKAAQENLELLLELNLITDKQFKTRVKHFKTSTAKKKGKGKSKGKNKAQETLSQKVLHDHKKFVIGILNKQEEETEQVTRQPTNLIGFFQHIHFNKKISQNRALLLTTFMRSLTNVAIVGNEDKAQILLSKENFDVNMILNDGRTRWNPALELAIRANNTNIVKRLLEYKGIDVNKVSRAISTSSSPLTVAAIHGYNKIIELLLANKDIEVNLQTSGGWTALHFAAAKGKPECVELLLKHRNIDVNLRNGTGSTALSMAIATKKLCVIEKFLQQRDDLEPRDLRDAFRYLAQHSTRPELKKIASLDIHDSKKQKILFLFKSDCIEEVEKILERLERREIVMLNQETVRIFDDLVINKEKFHRTIKRLQTDNVMELVKSDLVHISTLVNENDVNFSNALERLQHEAILELNKDRVRITDIDVINDTNFAQIIKRLKAPNVIERLKSGAMNINTLAYGSDESFTDALEGSKADSIKSIINTTGCISSIDENKVVQKNLELLQDLGLITKKQFKHKIKIFNPAKSKKKGENKGKKEMLQKTFIANP